MTGLGIPSLLCLKRGDGDDMQNAKPGARNASAQGENSVVWANETRRLDELVPWEFNPRQIDDAHLRRLVHSRSTFGQVEPIAIGPGNELYNGHQRLKAWAAEFGPSFVVDVRVASRALTQEERQELTILLHEGAVGKFNLDVLANWPGVDVPQLLDWGMSPFKLGIDVDLLEPETQPQGTELPPPGAGLRRCPQCGYEW